MQHKYDRNVDWDKNEFIPLVIMIDSDFSEFDANGMQIIWWPWGKNQ